MTDSQGHGAHLSHRYYTVLECIICSVLGNLTQHVQNNKF